MENKTTLTEFIQNIADNHEIQHIDNIDGVVCERINNELYLVNTKKVEE